MVAMGRALMSKPRMLLMDEPSMGLSPALVQQNFRIIKEVHESGVAVLMVEQNANMALSIADRGYVLSTGEIVLEGPAADLLKSEDLKRAYLGGSPPAPVPDGVSRRCKPACRPTPGHTGRSRRGSASARTRARTRGRSS